MSHAHLFTAEEASGKLVSLVRENAKKLAEEHKFDLVLIDGPPGIGCPVIASITGVDLVVVITEPTLSAIHDLDRMIKVSKHFKIPAVVCINKYTINEDNTAIIENYCQNNDISVVGKIPYDISVTDAMVAEQTIIEYTTNHVSQAINTAWDGVWERLNL
jgi:MinD superfamily P-loop ATPase